MQEGTITIEPDISGSYQSLTIEDFHAVREGNMKEVNLKVPDGQGTVTFPIETPGEMTRIRMGGFYRARAPRTATRCRSPSTTARPSDLSARWPARSAATRNTRRLDKIPAGTKSVKVRFAGRTQNTTMMFNFRIDADYKLPNSGFAPVQVTYLWEEGGARQEGRSRRQAGALRHTRSMSATRPS